MDSHQTIVHCTNCDTPLPTEKSKFCPECGQNQGIKVRTFKEIVVDFLRFVTTLDGKMWLTLKTLFTRPGELTLAFERGQHARYIVPWRLVFLTVVISFLLDKIIPDMSDKDRANNYPRYDAYDQHMVNRKLYLKLDSIAVSQPDSVQQSLRMALGIMDTISPLGKLSSDSLWCLGPAGGYNIFSYSDTLKVSKDDYFALDQKALKKKYGFTHLQAKAVEYVFSGLRARSDHQDNLLDNNFSWILLGHSVLFASVLALFYRRKVWQMHFIFNLHTCCFFTLTSEVLDGVPFGNSGTRLLIYLFALMVYNWFSYKHFYKPTGWRKNFGFFVYSLGFFIVLLLLVGILFSMTDRIF
jgi:hypothetical protein